MKDPRKERFMLWCFLSLLTVAALADSLSGTAGQMRSRKPWIAWLALHSGRDMPDPPALYLLTYRWDDRVLNITQMPPTPDFRRLHSRLLREAPGKTAYARAFAADDRLIESYGSQFQQWISPQLTLHWVSDLPDPASQNDVKEWIAAWPRTFRFWWAIPKALSRFRRYENSEPGGYGAVLLAREAFRLDADKIRLHNLPMERDRAAFFSRIQSSSVETFQKPTTIEVLNASGQPGVALEATKILRWRGLDVVDFGNASTPSPFTRFVDRTAAYIEAADVARILGCDRPTITDEMDSARQERVTVILGQDFKSCASFSGSSKL